MKSNRRAGLIPALASLTLVLLVLAVPGQGDLLLAHAYSAQAAVHRMAEDIGIPVAAGPDAPILVEATSGDAENVLRWSRVEAATGYVVYRSDGSGFTPVGFTRTPELRDRISTGRQGVYSYAVAATANGRQGELSTSAAADVVHLAALVTADEDYTISASTGEIKLFIPAHTFSKDTTLTIDEVFPQTAGPDSNTAFFTGTYELGPHGLTFNDTLPTLTLAYEGTDSSEDFERDWVAATARLYYAESSDSIWADVTESIRIDVAANTVSNDLRHFSAYASGYTVMPHGRYTQDSVLCSTCHVAHDAAGDALGTRADLDLCYYCHGADVSTADASGAHGANVQAQFLGSSDQSATTAYSRHPVQEGEMRCSDCHAVHADPDEYPKLLFAWNADGSKTKVDDDSGVIGNDFCFGCHGTFDNANVNAEYYAASGGDHESDYTTGHAALTYEPAATDDSTCAITPSNGSGIQCLVCHQQHGSEDAGYLNSFEAGQPADKEALCYTCHLDSGTAATWNGRYIPEEFSRASSHDITGATGAQLTCANCHNSHTVGAGNFGLIDSPSIYGYLNWDPARFSDPDNTTGSVATVEAFCLRCHDGSPPVKTLTESTIVPYTVSFPDWSSDPFFTGWDKSGMTSSAHYNATTGNMDVRCDSCHDPHGSDNARLTAFSGGYGLSPISMHGSEPPNETMRENDESYAEEGLCYGCHAWTGGCGCHYSGHDIRNLAIKTQLSKLPADAAAQWSEPATVGASPSRYIYETLSLDVNNDGRLDVIATDYSLTNNILLFVNNGGSPITWTSSTLGTLDRSRYAIDSGDFNSDGLPDLVFGNYNTIYLLMNKPSSPGTFTQSTLYTRTGSYYTTDVAIDDIDGDGDDDIAWCVYRPSVESEVYTTSNLNGLGTSWQTTLRSTGSAEITRQIVTGDFTGTIIDGKPAKDIVMTSWVGSPIEYRLSLIKPTASGSWTRTAIDTRYDYMHRAMSNGDFDADGDDDIVAGIGANVMRYSNDAGDGSTWSPLIASSTGGTVNAVSTGDINGDATIDILVGRSSSNHVSALKNIDGDGNTWVHWVVDSTVQNCFAITSGDINGDTKMDVIAGLELYPSGAPVVWYENYDREMPVSAHPTNDYKNRHSSNETATDLGAENRHAECVDCHDVHLARHGSHTMGTNVASQAIYGSRGVSPASRSAWTAPASYTEKVITYEYELCYKCHSSYTTGYTGEDKAKEFNPANLATHPVEGTGANLGIRDGSFVEGTPWNPTAGDDADYSATSPKMTCTDCHASETETDPRGPHGSTITHILRGTASTSTVGDLSESTLCFVCHDSAVYGHTTISPGTGGSQPGETSGSEQSRVNHKHFYYQGAQCLECHAPHGSNSQHLIEGTYTHTATGGTIRSFTSCDSIGGCHSSGTSRTYTSNY